jgi:hypothetical protein
MRSYNWFIPITRLLFSAPIALVVVVISHTGMRRYSSLLYHCNGGWHAAISVFLQLCLASAIIEFFMWISWLMFTRLKLHSGGHGSKETKRSRLESQKLFGPDSAQWRLGVAAILIVIGARIVGLPDACPDLDITKFSLRLFVGGLIFMYAVMMALFL